MNVMNSVHLYTYPLTIERAREKGWGLPKVCGIEASN